MRLVVEHEDGRRVGVDEQLYGHPSGNPFNASSRVFRDDSNEISYTPGRPTDEHQSLLSEGFKVVGIITDDGGERGLTDEEKRSYA